MRLFNILFLAFTIASGALAKSARADVVGDALIGRSIDSRANQCASDDAMDKLDTDKDAEDFTAQTKRSVEDVGDSGQDIDLTDRDLEIRDNRHWCGTTPTAGNGQYVEDSTSYNAVSTGFALALAGVTRISNSGRHYPKRFYNNEGLGDVTFYCPGGPWYEFPVYPNANRVFGYNTDNPDTERVIFDRCGNWCATITHRGETGNRFHGCVAA